MKNNDCNIPFITQLVGYFLVGVVLLYVFKESLGYPSWKCFLEKQGSLVGALIGAIVLAGTVVYTIKSQAKNLKDQIDNDRELAALDKRARDVERIREYLIDVRTILHEDYDSLCDPGVYKKSKSNIMRACNSISSTTQKMKVGDTPDIDAHADAVNNIYNLVFLKCFGDKKRYLGDTDFLIQKSLKSEVRDFLEDCSRRVKDNCDIDELVVEAIELFSSQSNKMIRKLGDLHDNLNL